MPPPPPPVELDNATVVVRRPEPPVVAAERPQNRTLVVVPRRGPAGPGGATPEDLEAIADALTAHVQATADVHGIPDTQAVVQSLSSEIDDGPDFALIWANLMA